MKYILVFTLPLFLIFCSKTKPKDVVKVSMNEEVPALVEEKSDTISTEDDIYSYITSKGLPDIRLGDRLADLEAKYSVIESVVIKEEGIEEPLYLIPKENIELEVEYDYKKEEFTDLVRDIVLRTDKYQTAEGITVGSTISDFILAYPSAEVFTSYTINDAWLVMQSLNNNIQFKVEMKHHNNQSVDIMNEFITQLDIADFDADAPIMGIRIFKVAVN